MKIFKILTVLLITLISKNSGRGIITEYLLVQGVAECSRTLWDEEMVTLKVTFGNSKQVFESETRYCGSTVEVNPNVRYERLREDITAEFIYKNLDGREIKRIEKKIPKDCKTGGYIYDWGTRYYCYIPNIRPSGK